MAAESASENRGLDGVKTRMKGTKLKAHKNKICCGLLAVLMIFATSVTEVSASDSVVISSKVNLKNSQLKDGQFSFELLDAETEERLHTASNDAEGNILFDPIFYDSDESGIYRYKIREVNGKDPFIVYDTNVYTVSIGVEKGTSAPQTLEEKYYGIKSEDPYGWYMSTDMGDKDYFVYCMDSTKPSPGLTATSSPYWIAELDPDDEMLLAALNDTYTVTSTDIKVPAYDGWLDDPSYKENLKRILYTITYGSLVNLPATTKAQLVWWAASGLDYMYQYKDSSIMESYMITCLNTTVPAGYELLMFHPSDGLSQPFVTLLKSDKTMVFQSEEVVFENTAIHSGYELPVTGGKGTAFMQSIGLLCTAAAPLLYILSRRHRSDNAGET